MSSGMTFQQKSIISLPDVLFRAGTVNSSGQQKGVDSLIVTDLIELGSNGAICDATLVTGDGDLAVGIELAQRKGVRVAVIGLEDLSVGVSHSQNFEITSRADRIGRWGGVDIRHFMRYIAPVAPSATPQPVPPVASSPVPLTGAPVAIHPGPAHVPGIPIPVATTSPLLVAPVDTNRIELLVKEFIKLQTSPNSSVDTATKSIDQVMDRALIFHVYSEFKHALSQGEKKFAREVFRKELGF